MKLLLRVLLTMAAFWVAAALVSGIDVHGGLVSYLVIAVIFGLVNLIIRPIVTLLSLPFVLLTLGLFLLVVNAAMLGLTALLTSRMDIDGFFPALFGSIVISVVTWGGDRVLVDHDT